MTRDSLVQLRELLRQASSMQGTLDEGKMPFYRASMLAHDAQTLLPAVERAIAGQTQIKLHAYLDDDWGDHPHRWCIRDQHDKAVEPFFYQSWGSPEEAQAAASAEGYPAAFQVEPAVMDEREELPC